MKCMYAARAMAFFLSAAVKKSPPPGKLERIFPMLAVWDWLVWTCFYICYN